MLQQKVSAATSKPCFGKFRCNGNCLIPVSHALDMLTQEMIAASPRDVAGWIFRSQFHRPLPVLECGIVILEGCMFSAKSEIEHRIFRVAPESLTEIEDRSGVLA